jgi:acyl-CoA thioesterase
MKFEDILAQARNLRCDGVDDSWAQGRTLFGGLTGAILCEASHGADRAPDQVLRELDIAFMRPVESDSPFELHREVLAAGKTVSTITTTLSQGGKVRAQAKACFVRPLESQVNCNTFVAPTLPAPDDPANARITDNVPAKFTQHFDNRLTSTGLPFSGSDVTEIAGWTAFADKALSYSCAHLVCLIDAWPPTAAPQYAGFAPLSTIGWKIHFSDQAQQTDISQHLGYRAEVNFCSQGLSSSSAAIWTPEGNLLANSFQTNIIFG